MRGGMGRRFQLTLWLLAVALGASCGPQPAPVTGPVRAGDAASSILQDHGATSALPAPAPPPERELEADTYTRYELLTPGSGKFRILYEVTAIDPGATAYFNPIRKGSVVSDEAVFDRSTSSPLAFEVVPGAEARKSGLPDADLDGSYLRVKLPRPVPAEGGVRLLIDKTYLDAKSYREEPGGRIVFDRPLGVRRNAIVLPAGYELTGCNVPAQVLSEPDGRLAVSFVHTGPEAAPLVLQARKLAGWTPPAVAKGDSGAEAQPAGGAPAPQPAAPRAGVGATPHGETLAETGAEPGGSPAPARIAPQPPPAGAAPAASVSPAGPAPRGEAERLSERAHQDREIVYFLQAPDSHAFRLYHDYTESRPGTDRYLNVVRAGSTVADPSARNLDTGEALKVETLRGADLPKEGRAGEGGVPREAQVVLVRFPPVQEKGSIRLRITETYTDPGSYRLEGEELSFDRTFGRPRNSVVLPAGWYLTATSIPALVTESPDGRLRLDFVNPRPDEIAVLIRARRRGL